MIGTTLQNRYLLESELGRGGMGVVYHARDTLLERQVAVKLVAAGSLGTEGRGRLLQEAQAAASLNHPHIVAVYDAGLAAEGEETGAAAFIVMELIDGRPLSDYQVADLEEALTIAVQIAAALEAAHEQGIIHRDLKPENVLVSSQPAGSGEPVTVRVKLMDFGLARISGRTRMTQEGALVGTMAYLAPEIILGQPATERSDLYSFGVLLYELVTGRPPFDGDTPTAILSQHLHAPVAPPNAFNDAVPPDLDALIIELLSKKPEKRPASAADIAEILRRLLRSPLDTRATALDPLDRLVRGRLVGRDEELAEAQSLWQQALSSHGQTLLISGEPGIGKTSLVRELSTIVELTGGQSLIGACYPETGAPYAPFAQIVQRALHRGNGNLALPEFVLAEMLSLAPELQIDYPDVPPNPPLDPEAGLRRLFDSLIIFSQVLSQKRPLLLVLEDAHWADDGTLALLRRLARRGRQQPMLIVATYREVELDRNLPFNQALMELQREGLANRIKLTRLDRQATERLLAEMFAEEITKEFLDGIYRETEGNPFFIEEVCKSLVESGELYFEDGVWRRPAMDKLAIPQSVRVAIQSRIAVLDEALQDVLRLAAILGREFDFDTLITAGSRDEDSLIDALEQAEQAQLIEEVSSERGATFAFVHALIPSTLVEDLSGLRQRRMHRQVARVIEDLRPEDWVTLAHHFRLAEDQEKALFYLTGSGDQAAARFAHKDAIRFFTYALDFADSDESRFDLLKKRAAVTHLAANREGEWADVQELLELAESLDDDNRRMDALLAQAGYHLKTEHVRTNKPAHQAAEIARSLDDPIREARALSLSGRASFFTGDFSRSQSDLETVAERFLAAGLAGEAAGALHSLSLTLANLGLNEEALEVGLRALDVSRESGDKVQEATSLRRIAIAHQNERRYERAMPFAKEALDLHRQLGDSAEEVAALNVLGILCSRLGDSERAAGLYRESIALAEEIESSSGIQYATFNASYYTASDGQYEEALNIITDQVEKHGNSPDKWLSGSLHSTQAIFLFLLGQYEKAIEAMEQSHPLLEGIQTAGSKAANLTFEAALRVAAGQRDEALKLANEAAVAAALADEGDSLDFYYANLARMHRTLGEEFQTGLEAADQSLAFSKKFSNDHTEIQSLNSKIRLHLALNQPERAHSALEALLPLLDRRDSYLHRQELMWTISKVMRAVGMENEANEALQEAFDYVQLIAAGIDDDELRLCWLENVTDNPQILEEAKKLGLAH
jgi:serine/threonine protein kinase